MITKCFNDYLSTFEISKYFLKILNDQSDVIMALFIFMGFEKLLKKNFKEAQICRTSIHNISGTNLNFNMPFSAL